MCANDYDDRRQDSIDYLNRLDDQLHFRETQRKKAKAVDDAIRTNDWMRVRLELGITPSEENDDRSGDTGEKRTPMTLKERFSEHGSNLRTALMLAQFLPRSFATEWVDRLYGLDMNRAVAALDAVTNLASAYEQNVRKFSPQRDVFNLGISDEMRFEQERGEITRAIVLLRETLNEAIANTVLNVVKKGLPVRQLPLREDQGQEVGESVSEGKPSLREESEALAKMSDSEAIVKCPGCNKGVKAKNLLSHFSRQHWWQENSRV